MAEAQAQSSRYYAMRSRVIVWLALALLAILVIPVFASIVTVASVPIATKLIIGLCLIPMVALALRTIFGFDLATTEHELIYRAALRTYRFDRSLVARVSVDDANSSNRIGKLKMAILHRTDGTVFPLKLFNSFRPNEASPEPVGYQRMQKMAHGVTAWADSSPGRIGVQEIRSPAD